jgi:hypothetical protein
MEIYLTRQQNGLYMLTKYPPIIQEIDGIGVKDAYIVPGEPIGIRNVCDLILKVCDMDKPIPRLETKKVNLFGNLIN